MEFRVGQGIDVHPFVTGRKIVLGGVVIPHDRGLQGHSDADVLIHAIADALLGAAGMEDIGVLFPNTDPRWKDVSSLVILGRVWSEISSQGWRIGNLDCTLLAEQPKLAPHVQSMKLVLASTIEIESNQIGIKATTSEKLGFIGRGEGVMAFVVVSLMRA